MRCQEYRLGPLPPGSGPGSTPATHVNLRRLILSRSSPQHRDIARRVVGRYGDENYWLQTLSKHCDRAMALRMQWYRTCGRRSERGGGLFLVLGVGSALRDRWGESGFHQAVGDCFIATIQISDAGRCVMKRPPTKRPHRYCLLTAHYCRAASSVPRATFRMTLGFSRART